MASLKRLKGVAHDVAAHSQSSLSWLHPHLAQACQRVGVPTVSVGILDADPFPVGFEPSEPLQSALSELRKWMETNLVTQGFSASDLQRAGLVFSFRQGGDQYDCAVAATLVDKTGRTHFAKLSFIGPPPQSAAG
jgi:hypothetical protein